MSTFPAVPQPIPASPDHVKRLASVVASLASLDSVQTVNIHAAKSQLSRLIEAVEAGEEVVIARAGKPVARLVPIDPVPEPRRLGTLNGKFDDTGRLRHDVRGRDRGLVRGALMRILLDTNVLLLACGSSSRLDRATSDMLEDANNTIFFSAASVWEIAIKTGLGRPNFKVSPEAITEAAHESGFTELPVTARIAARAVDLPHYHRDPFDRLLIVQAMAEPAIFLTTDRALTRYTDLVTLIQGRTS